MNAIVRAWDRFFFSRFDPHPLGLLRIALAMMWLILMGFMSFNWRRFYAPDGLGSAIDPASWRDPWTLFRLTDGVCDVMVWWWIGVVAGVLLLVGCLTRVMTVVVWAILQSMIHREPLLTGGGELVLRMALWWGMFMPLGRALSVDEWLRGRSKPDHRPMPVIWSTRMFQINVVMIFAFSLPLKLLNDPSWVNGDAFFFAIINDTWSRWPWPELFYTKWISLLLSYTTIVIEVSFIVLVWTRWRVIAVVFMWIFHLLIIVMLANVTLFNLATMATYFVFSPPGTARVWVAKLKWVRWRNNRASL